MLVLHVDPLHLSDVRQTCIDQILATGYRLISITKYTVTPANCQNRIVFFNGKNTEMTA